MKHQFRLWIPALAVLGAAAMLSGNTDAQLTVGARPARGAEVSAAERVDEMSPQDKEILGYATEFAAEATQVLERWLGSNAISEDKLFSRLYYPIPDTDPTKFNTDYDTIADRDLPGIQEKYFSKSNTIQYAILTDLNGYVPTHNRQYSQPLTKNKAVDLVNNRTKRIFGDWTGFNAARNINPHLLQRYQRDTGETVADLSVPVKIRGRHFGCVRIGYRSVKK